MNDIGTLWGKFKQSNQNIFVQKESLTLYLAYRMDMQLLGKPVHVQICFDFEHG